MKNIIRILNILICGLIGSLFGYGASVFQNYRAYPEQYIAQSAPWYIGILFYGIIVLAFVACAWLAKYILRKRIH